METLERLAPPNTVTEIGPGRFRVRASTPTVARDGMAIPTGSWRLENFRQNPVLLWAHRRDELPIGRATIHPTEESLDAEIEFSPPGLNPFADTVARMWAAGYVRAVSVGGSIHRTTQQSDHVRVDEIELVDLSVVPVGGDPAALGRALDIETDHLERLFSSTQTITSATPTQRLEARRRTLMLRRRHLK